MARSGFSTSNYLELGSAIKSGAPMSVSAWGFTSITGAQQNIFTINAATNTNDFQLYVDAANKVNWNAVGAGSNAIATTTTTFSANTWFHMMGVEVSTSSRAAYLNGAGKGTNATARTPASLVRTVIGAFHGATVLVPWAPAGTGRIAEVGVWSVALADADVATLALGVCPLLVHPESLIAYWPLIGTYSPEINLLSNTSVMSITGSLSQSAHTRVLRSSQRQVITPPAAAAAVKVPWGLWQARAA